MSEHQGSGMVTGLLIGAVVGAGLALLLAPASGSETRRRLKAKAQDLGNKANALGESAAAGSDSAREGAGGRDTKVVVAPPVPAVKSRAHRPATGHKSYPPSGAVAPDAHRWPSRTHPST